MPTSGPSVVLTITSPSAPRARAARRRPAARSRSAAVASARARGAEAPDAARAARSAIKASCAGVRAAAADAAAAADSMRVRQRCGRILGNWDPVPLGNGRTQDAPLATPDFNSPLSLAS